MMSAPLSFEVMLDPAETVRASRYVQNRVRFVWLGWLVWVALALQAVVHLSTGARVRDLWLVCLVGVMLATARPVGSWLQRRQLRRAYAESPTLRVPQVYTFTAEGLTMTGGSATTTLGWPAIVEAEETNEFFLMFINKRCAYYLPKRVVGGAARESELRALLRGHLAGRGAKLRAG